jgi:hypothetical protein
LIGEQRPSVAIDTMLQGPELLNLTVKDVALGSGKCHRERMLSH